MLPDLAQLTDFAKRYTEAWCSHIPARVAAHYSPQGSLRINDAAPAVGRNAIAEAAQSFMSAFPDLKVLLDDVVIKGDRALYHWTLLGTNTGPGGTGKRVRISGTENWKIGDDALIEESQGSFDVAEYRHQIEHGVEDSR
jgi:nuclear transport factor 2 (NTF2) superfamily protein